MLVLISCVFPGICSFHLNHKRYCYKVVCNIILLFKVYRICNDVFFFIPDIGNFCFLFLDQCINVLIFTKNQLSILLIFFIVSYFINYS